MGWGGQGCLGQWESPSEAGGSHIWRVVTSTSPFQPRGSKIVNDDKTALA